MQVRPDGAVYMTLPRQLAETVVRLPGPVVGVLAFLDVLLGGAALIVL
jgi:hypothetical protein